MVVETFEDEEEHLMTYINEGSCALIGEEAFLQEVIALKIPKCFKKEQSMCTVVQKSERGDDVERRTCYPRCSCLLL